MKKTLVTVFFAVLLCVTLGSRAIAIEDVDNGAGNIIGDIGDDQAAESSADDETPSTVSPDDETPPTDSPVGEDEGPEESKARYVRFEGVIEEVEDGEKNGKRIKAVGEITGGAETISFNVSDSTTLIDATEKRLASKDDLSVGQRVICAYGVNTPALMSEPPQISPEVIILMSENGSDSVKIDYFDEDGISSDGGLKLNLSDETVTVDYNGEPVKTEDVSGNSLVVFYNITTRSQPPQTNPVKIFVLRPSVTPETVTAQGGSDENAVEADTPETVIGNLADGDRIVRNDASYVRLRKVSELLGANISWNEDSRTVILDHNDSEYVLTIDEAFYTADGDQRSLANSPFIHNDYTYVEEAFLTSLF
ncbi:MAG: copper amine oxidase N-terminal domain-containing protein [Clostridiales bacterium]|jgi:hypothetical protein|nr:copper amine oxidase N-terminal domain-containing protein [Clostridiales bacterium]